MQFSFWVSPPTFFQYLKHIEKATIEFQGDFFIKSFQVTSSDAKKIENVEDLERIRKALMEAIDDGDDANGGLNHISGRGVVVKKSVAGLESLGRMRAKAEKMFGLMDGFLKNDPMNLQKDILDHVEYTVARSKFNFDDFEAYQAVHCPTLSSTLGFEMSIQRLYANLDLNLKF